jgi:hypothetical protein
MKNHFLLIISIFFVISSFGQTKQLTVSDFVATDCKSECEVGIIKSKVKWRKLELVIGVHAHCCMQFESDAYIENDSLFIVHYKYGNPCRCYCNYELTYKVKGVKRKHLKKMRIIGKWHEDWDTIEKRKEKSIEKK